MTPESNILIAPFRAAFPDAGHASDFSLGHPDCPQRIWVWFDSDKVTIRYGHATHKVLTIGLTETCGSPCLHVVLPPQQDIYSHDWLHLAEQLEHLPDCDLRKASIRLMRQVGGDADFAGHYTLHPVDDY